MFINLLSAILKHKFKFFLILFLFFSNTSFASFEGDVETVSYILEGFDHNASTHDCFDEENDDVETVSSMLEEFFNNVSTCMGCTHNFLIACFNKNDDEIKTFLSNEKFDINEKFYYEDTQNYTNDIFLTGLYLASSYNCKSTVKQLLLDSKINPNVVVKEKLGNTTAFHIACQREHTDIVDLLLDHKKTNVNKKAKMGVTALHLAVFSGNYKLVKKLLQVSDIDVLARTVGGRSAMEIALMYQHKNIANILRAHKDVDMSYDEMLELEAAMLLIIQKKLPRSFEPENVMVNISMNTAIIITLGFIGVFAGMVYFPYLKFWYYDPLYLDFEMLL